VEIEFMIPYSSKSTDIVWLGRRFAVLTLAVALAGCSPEGAGSIKIENPEAVRDKVAGGSAIRKPATPKEAKARELEDEAAKKHGKLR
jgi:hypothetical protein